jgi:lipopolysaccharide export system protein LptA
MCVQPTNYLNIARLLLLNLSLYASTGWALQADVEKPVEIEADSAVFDKMAGTASYSGNVLIHQGTLEIRASNIRINAPGNEIKSIIAEGAPVSFKQKMDNGRAATGQAKAMKYFVAEKRLTLTGNAELTQDKDRFASNFIEYLPESGQLRAGAQAASNGESRQERGGRVSAIFYPTNKAQ